MAYVLGYITADGCVSESRTRKNHPLTLNITSKDKDHLIKLKKILASEHKISKKTGSAGSAAFQIQIRNDVLTADLVKLGILPRKTKYLRPIKVSDKYFVDFVRGFFDGDGSVYIYVVNDTLQIKANFISTSLSFIKDINQKLCKKLEIPLKNIHKTLDKRRQGKMEKYEIVFYINDCEKLMKLMYKNSHSLCLCRKLLIFKRWGLIKRRHYIKQNYPSKIGWQLNKKI